MRLLKALFILLLIGVVALAGLAYWVDAEMSSPVAHDRAGEFIAIEQGMAAGQIVRKLERQGILQTPLATKLYLKVYGDNLRLEAGDYRIPSPVSPKEVFALLNDGKKRTQSVTFPEGWTRFEIAARIAARFPAEPALGEADVLELMNDVSLIRDFDPRATNLEGYLYPTTYEFALGTHPKEVIARTVAQFRAVWTDEWSARAKALGRTNQEIVTIASLIENESKVATERPVVASVIYNRLRRGMPLGIDATNVYIAKLLGRWDGIIHKSDVEVDHPYNTRKIRGLPPGPISSASRSAIEAALQPAQTDYLYYVLNVEKNDGSHHFYAMGEGFLSGKAAYQRWLAKQR